MKIIISLYNDYGSDPSLYVKDIDEQPRRNTPISYNLNRNVSIVFELIVTKAHDDLRMLSQAQRTCVFSDEGPAYNTCAKKCLTDKVVELCECVAWFGIGDTNARECYLHEYACSAKKMRKIDCTKECYLNCEHTDYMVVRIENSKTTSIGLWWPTVVYIRKTRFGWLDLLVSFGGIMGLFIGYSILTTVELIYYFSLRSYCGAVHDQKQDDNVLKIRVIERKKPDLSQIKYYDYVE